MTSISWSTENLAEILFEGYKYDDNEKKKREIILVTLLRVFYHALFVDNAYSNDLGGILKNNARTIVFTIWLSFIYGTPVLSKLLRHAGRFIGHFIS